MTRILHVEDSASDRALTKEAIDIVGIDCELIQVQSAADALVAIAASPPQLILLDLNLPGMKGHELLSTLKQNPKWLSIPVLILSSSENQREIARSYVLHANGYLAKPTDFDGFISLFEAIDQFWLRHARLPSPG